MTLMLISLLGAVAALVFAAVNALKIKKQPEGTDKMKKIADAIRKGANAYLRRQYRSVSIFFIIVFFVLLLLALFDFVNIFVPFAFLTGGIFSGLAGFFGMKVATASNSRTAWAAKKSLNSGLRVAFSAGSVMGFVVVGLGILDTGLWYILLDWYYSSVEVLAEAQRIVQISSTMLTFGIGASSMALFARVGGGIFTKAADVGADIVGKVEAGIPEDDPRNPAVIADNVGDNVGDVAGMGADLYESFTGARLSASALAVSAGLGLAGFALPMLLSALGVFASIIGSFFVKTKETTDQRSLLGALRRGTYISSVIIAIASFFLVKMTLGMENIGVFFAILAGLVAGNLIGYFTEYYTSDTYSPTKKLADSSETGTATIIINGFGLGMKSTAIPVVIVAISVLASFYLAGHSDSGLSISMGLFGVAISAVGMLSTLGITLATDAYGPVADNAGGIAQMADLGDEVRERTDALDALGNTTAATGKGFAIGSAALTALALIVSYIDQIKIIDPNYTLDLSITNPPTLIGLFIGGMLPFLFSSLTMEAVGKAAHKVALEVRRQFSAITGIMDGTADPDYSTCVDICTKSAQKGMIPPAVLAVVSPIIVGLFLGVNGVAGMLAGVTITGFVLAVMMSNSGGAWDNAKKHIEQESENGKGSERHKAAVVGDTVGDPFKDTAGPSINILIKLISIVAIVFVSFAMQYHLF